MAVSDDHTVIVKNKDICMHMYICVCIHIYICTYNMLTKKISIITSDVHLHVHENVLRRLHTNLEYS